MRKQSAFFGGGRMAWWLGWPEGDDGMSSYVVCFFTDIASSSAESHRTRASRIKRLFIFFSLCLIYSMLVSCFSVFVEPSI
jgi:hypothetical protein